MLRSFLLGLSRNRQLKNLMVKWRLARLASRRFVAGETLEQAVEVVHTLNMQGINGTLDQLGENTVDANGARKSAEDIIRIIDAIVTHGLRANVSLKLSQIGLSVDLDVCEENLLFILEHARKTGVFVRIDMEGSDLTEKTFSLYEQMIHKGFTNVGIVLQAYLYRTEKDIDKLLDWGGKVRLCKGAYIEPHLIAFPRKSDVDSNYDRLALKLIKAASDSNAPRLSKDGRTPPIPALATHDSKRIDFAKQKIKQMDTPIDAVEFQMLYGIRRDLQSQAASEGYPVRVYVPFGTQWYPYFMRRLAERPANLWFFLSNFFRK